MNQPLPVLYCSRTDREREKHKRNNKFNAPHHSDMETGPAGRVPSDISLWTLCFSFKLLRDGQCAFFRLNKKTKQNNNNSAPVVIRCVSAAVTKIISPQTRLIAGGHTYT